ncbi:MAG TPA: biotin-dependent carboxyltransferase family protein [Verrucomicrobiae bacterium]|nr:biotin-dependent carboxyltransferase family protein [Verrucomicrobiae bacterium]
MRVLDSGLGVSIQDRGRPGWRRFGVPIGGSMDPHAASCANRLLDNDPGAALIELLLQGSRLEMLQDAWIALCGAPIECSIPTWRAYPAQAGEVVSIKKCRSGMWSYLAVEGGFSAKPFFGSASFYGRGNLGTRLSAGSLLERNSSARFHLAAGVSGRVASWEDQRDYASPPRIRVWPGPQWNDFSPADRDTFLTAEWKISPQSDRVGYRLEGPRLPANPPEIVSEPVRLGSVQVPENGQPIITMRDGPTVGGYPKIALIDEEHDLPWVAQARPGETIRFQLIS